MTTQAAIIGVGIVLLAGFVIVLPFLTRRGRRWQRSTEQTSVGELEDQLSQLISGVRDLDFDFDMGKVPEADYATHRKALIGRGVSVLRRLEEARAAQRELDDELEQQIAAHRRKKH